MANELNLCIVVWNFARQLDDCGEASSSFPRSVGFLVVSRCKVYIILRPLLLQGEGHAPVTRRLSCDITMKWIKKQLLHYHEIQLIHWTGIIEVNCDLFVWRGTPGELRIT